MLKNKIRRCVSALLSLTVVLAAGGIVAFADGSDPSLGTAGADYNSYIGGSGYSDVKDAAVKSAEGEAVLKTGEEISFDLAVPESGLYNIAVSYKSSTETAEKFDISLYVDGESPFAACEKLELPLFYEDSGEKRLLPTGDEIASEQKQTEGNMKTKLFDTDGIISGDLKFAFSAGSHKITLKNTGVEMVIAGIELTAPEKVASYADVSASYDGVKKYGGKQIVIEAEDTLYRTSSSLMPKSDRSSSDISPRNPSKSVVNFIGGENWASVGDSICWEFTAPEDGLYSLGFSFKQSYVTNGEVFRSLKIDGKTPFEEASCIGFAYKTDWQFAEYSDDNGDPYLFYLTEGPHTIEMSVTIEKIADFAEKLGKVVEDLGDLYLDILMITGEAPDANRDYELHKQIPDFVDVLKTSKATLEELDGYITDGLPINKEISGSLRNTVRIISEMTSHLYEAHKQITSLSSAQQTLSAWLYDMRGMSLSLDKIVIGSPDKELNAEGASFFESIAFGFKRFISAFSKDYASTTLKGKDVPSIKLWVNWGRDQVKVLSNLIYSDFSAKHNINVTIEQVNTSLVQGVISGNSPDVYLHMSRSEPVNLAMRGVLYDLSQFEDFETVLDEYFQEGAETPYRYNGGCYALPDIQHFYIMFYRKDIFDKLNLSVPTTWDEFLNTTAYIQRNKMNVYLPYTKIAGTTTVNVGAGGLTIFPALLMQQNAKLYNDKLNATSLSTDTAVDVFTFWTDFYKKYGLDPQANFYNKFRAGSYPMGISDYSLVFQIMAGAPEIDGKWDVAVIPGVKQEDGTINNTCAGAGSGCSIMNSSKEKEAAWEFLKWWDSAETQYRYSSELEAILGETARVMCANTGAVDRLSWDPKMKEVIFKQWESVKEVEEIPGSYYVSRSIDQAFWAVYNNKQTPRDALIKWDKVSNLEIERKIKEYS